MPAPTTIPLYGVGTFDFAFTPAGANPRAGYDPGIYPDAANLAPAESGAEGLNVVLTVTAPDGTSHDWPGFWNDDYAYTPQHAGEQHVNAYPTFEDGPRVLYSPRQGVGTYLWTCRAQDKGSPGWVTLGSGAFAVTDTGLPGHLRPCAAAPSLVQTEREALTQDASLVFGVRDYALDTTIPIIGQAAAGGARAPVLNRLWAGQETGIGVWGSFEIDQGTNSAFFECWNPAALASFGPVAHNSAGGRNFIQIRPGDKMGFYPTLQPGVSYTVEFDLLLGGGADAPTGGNARLYLSGDMVSTFIAGGVPDQPAYHQNSGYTAFAALSATAITTVRYTWDGAGVAPWGADNYQTRFWVNADFTAGHLYVAGFRILDPQGRDVYREGDLNWHTRSGSRRQSVRLDALCRAADAVGEVYLRPVMWEKKDAGLGGIRADGTSYTSGYDPGVLTSNFYGADNDVASDIYVRRRHRDCATYAVARWAPYQALALLEAVNEAAIGDGQHRAFLQNLAHAAHAWDPTLPVTSSTFFNSGGPNYDLTLFEPAGAGSLAGTTSGGAPVTSLPDLYGLAGCGDEHSYNGKGGGLELNELGDMLGAGWSWLDGGGPDGETVLRLSPGSGDPHLTFHGVRLQGQGQWTVSWQQRAGGGFASTGQPAISIWVNDPLGLGRGFHADLVPTTAVPTAADYDWTTCTAHFSLADGDTYTWGNNFGWWFYPSLAGDHNITAGTLDFRDLQIRDPQGRLAYRFVWDSPLVDVDAAAMALSAARMYGGRQGLGMPHPMTLGELGWNNPRGLTPWPGVAGATLASDNRGDYAREIVWSRLVATAIPLWWNPVADDFANRGWYRFVAALRAMTRDARLGSGHHAEADVVMSTRELLPVATWDPVNRIGLVWVRNRSGCWYNQTYPGAAAAMPVVAHSGTATLVDVPDGPWVVETWPTDAVNVVGGVAAPLSTQTITASGGAGLAIPVPSIERDVAFKVTPMAGVSILNFTRGFHLGT